MSPSPPSCARVCARLEQFLDGTLDPLEAALDRGHLEACAGCRGELGAWRALVGGVRVASRAPVQEAQRVIAAVLADLPAMPDRRSRPWRPRLAWLAAAGLLLFAWLGTREDVLAHLREGRAGLGTGFRAPLEELPSWSQLADGWGRLARRIS